MPAVLLMMRHGASSVASSSAAAVFLFQACCCFLLLLLLLLLIRSSCCFSAAFLVPSLMLLLSVLSVMMMRTWGEKKQGQSGLHCGCPSPAAVVVVVALSKARQNEEERRDIVINERVAAAAAAAAPWQCTLLQGPLLLRSLDDRLCWKSVRQRLCLLFSLSLQADFFLTLSSHFSPSQLFDRARAIVRQQQLLLLLLICVLHYHWQPLAHTLFPYSRISDWHWLSSTDWLTDSSSSFIFIFFHCKSLP